MYCIRCGKQLKDNAKYCIYCGASTVKTASPRPQSNQDSGIPDDFDISLPKNFISSTPETEAYSPVAPDKAWELMEIVSSDLAPKPVPDDIESETFTQVIPAKQTVTAVADDIESESFTQVIPVKQPVTAVADDIESESFTQVIPKTHPQAVASAEDTDEASEQDTETPLDDIPDIPIPQDFITGTAAPSPAQHTTPRAAEQSVPRYASQPVYQDSSEEDPDQMLSKRGLIAIVLVIVLLFSIALGACIIVLRGDTVSIDDGSGSAASADVNAWGSDSPEQA